MTLLFSIPPLLALAFMFGAAYHADRKQWKAASVWALMVAGMIGLEIFLMNSMNHAIRSTQEQAQQRKLSP